MACCTQIPKALWVKRPHRSVFVCVALLSTFDVAFTNKWDQLFTWREIQFKVGSQQCANCEVMLIHWAVPNNPSEIHHLWMTDCIIGTYNNLHSESPAHQSFVRATLTYVFALLSQLPFTWYGLGLNSTRVWTHRLLKQKIWSIFLQSHNPQRVCSFPSCKWVCKSYFWESMKAGQTFIKSVHTLFPALDWLQRLTQLSMTLCNMQWPTDFCDKW